MCVRNGLILRVIRHPDRGERWIYVPVLGKNDTGMIDRIVCRITRHRWIAVGTPGPELDKTYKCERCGERREELDTPAVIRPPEERA